MACLEVLGSLRDVRTIVHEAQPSRQTFYLNTRMRLALEPAACIHHLPPSVTLTPQDLSSFDVEFEFEANEFFTDQAPLHSHLHCLHWVTPRVEIVMILVLEVLRKTFLYDDEGGVFLGAQGQRVAWKPGKA